MTILSFKQPCWTVQILLSTSRHWNKVTSHNRSHGNFWDQFWGTCLFVNIKPCFWFGNSLFKSCLDSAWSKETCINYQVYCFPLHARNCNDILPFSSQWVDCKNKQQCRYLGSVSQLPVGTASICSPSKALWCQSVLPSLHYYFHLSHI